LCTLVDPARNMEGVKKTLCEKAKQVVSRHPRKRDGKKEYENGKKSPKGKI